VGVAAAALAVVGAITAFRSSSDGSQVRAVNVGTSVTKPSPGAVKGTVHRTHRARAPRRETHTFVWPKVQGATSYRVEFFTRDQQVFAATLKSDRLDLPRRWRYGGRLVRLIPGTYQWQVRPVFGDPPTSVGDPIIRSNWIAR
jgi:hypothetical protein